MQYQPTTTPMRNSNLELFRIIAMLGIVAHHYVVNSGLLEIMEAHLSSWHTYFLFIFGMWGKIGINCFVLITGYFMCQSTITLRKFLKLYLEIVFYNIIFWLIFTCSHYSSFSWESVAHMIVPIGSISKGFTGCFLIFYLLIPFLTILVKNITQKQHQYLLALIAIFFVLWDHVPGVEVSFSYVSWFCALFVIASYIRFYGNILCRGGRRALIAISITAVAVLSVAFQIFGKAHGWFSGWAMKWVSDSNAILAILTGVVLFEYFKDLHIPQSRFINAVGGSTFGVLLIHANSDTMRRWLWQDVCQNTQWYDSLYMPLHAIGCVLIIFSVCIALDRLRIMCVEKPFFAWLDRRWLKSK